MTDLLEVTMPTELDRFFEFKCRKGFDALGLSGKEYEDRLNYEIACIKKMGFSGYLLIVQDLLNWASRNDILCGPGRGSAAGSLVCYVLGITKADPIVHGLIFERFLNPDRISMPDIDMDFEIDRREEVVEYVKQVYGKDKVARITTFSEMQPKGAIRDVARVMEVPYVEADKIAKSIDESKTLYENVESNTDFIDLIGKDEVFEQSADIAAKLEGNIRHSGVHAAGVVIGDKSLSDYMPVYTSKKTEDNLTQFAMGDVEEVGLIKFDFLGLKNLSIIHMCMDLIRERHGTKINLDDLTNSLDDPLVYKLFANGDTTNVFQFESDGIKRCLKRIEPTRFDDIVAMNALYRPGPLDSGMLDDFIKRKNDPSLVEYPDPAMEEHLENTYGLYIYQEQLMKLCEVVAGYTLSDADNMRKIVGKKLLDKMKAEREKFVSGCLKNGVSRSEADMMFNDIEKFGRYSFNRSHSVAYSIIAYWTAWFKVHYPVEFMTSVLSYESGEKDKLFTYINEARTMGIEFLPPDINKSIERFSIEDNKIRYALGSLEGVGVDTAKEIIEKRKKHGDFFSVRGVIELCDNRKVTSQVIENLVKSNALSSFGIDKSKMLALIAPSIEFKKKRKMKEMKDQLALFKRELDLADLKITEYERPPKSERDKYEMEALGFYLFENPLKEHYPLIKQHTTHTLLEVKNREVDASDAKNIVIAGYVNSIKVVKRKSDGAPLAFVKLSDGMCEVEVCVFTREYAEFGSKIKKNELIFFKGYFKDSDGNGQLAAKSATLLDELPKLKTDKSFINMTTGNGHKISFEVRCNQDYINYISNEFENVKEGI